MNEIRVVGTQEFMGKQINVLEGGFGENQRIITAKEVAEIHNMRLADLNASIKRLIDKSRLKEGIDYLDLLSETVSLRDFAKENGLIGSNKTSVVFVLSERGYSKLVKSMDDDESWEVMDKLIDEYFTMRQIIKSDEQLKAMYLLKAVESNGEESALAIKAYSDIRIKEETKPLLEEINNKNKTIKQQQDDINIKTDIITGFTDDIDIYTKRMIVNRIIKKCVNGNYKQRYNEMYKCFKESYHIDLQARCEGYNMKQTKKKDKLSVIKYAEAFGHIEGLYETACKLYHTEVQQLLKELGKVVN